MLDVGCGNGAMLRAFSQAAPGWSLAGTELGDKYRRLVESIPGVESLYTCPPGEVPGQFDVITMIHVLEHIPQPAAFLDRLLPKLVPGGLLVVELPASRGQSVRAADCRSLHALCRGNRGRPAGAIGAGVLSVAEDWVPKELTLVARRPATPLSPGFHRSARRVPPDRRICRLGRIALRSESAGWARFRPWPASWRRSARSACSARRSPATWLFAELEGGVGFFVDEDPHRVGKHWQGCPVYHPRQVPAGSRVSDPVAPAAGRGHFPPHRPAGS